MRDGGVDGLIPAYSRVGLSVFLLLIVAMLLFRRSSLYNTAGYSSRELRKYLFWEQAHLLQCI